MCGLAGLVSDKPAAQEQLEAMGQRLAHRGPDDSGVLRLDGCDLIHRRLSILDLSASRQPMSDPDRRFHIVFNGEIYNYTSLRQELEARGHRFATHGDTEVLLRLFMDRGEDCVDALRGMFAFAIWDAQDRTLFCARDRYGQKPFFYHHANGSFVFASEIKAILPALGGSPEVDIHCLYHYAGLRFCPDDQTLLAGILKLPPASRLWLRGGRVQVERYWDVDYHPKWTGNERSITEELHGRLADSVDSHMVSDVPVGTFLSGGVDSSIVTALAASSHSGPLPTFAIGSPDADFSELPYSRQVAEKFQTNHREKTVSPDLIEVLPEMIWHMEEPGDPHGVGIYLLSQFTHPHVKVVLGGDGGDEMFAGYTRYRGQALRQHYARVPAWFRRHVVGPMTGLIPESFSYYSLASKARWLNESSFLSPADSYYHNLVFFRFADEWKQRLFTDTALGRVEDRNTAERVTRHFRADNASNLVDKILYTDSQTRMPHHYLLIGDRLSMAFGLELRVPLIDHPLAEYAARIPAKMKMNWKRQKHILKTVGEKFFSSAFLDRTKKGFGYPMARWFRAEWKGLAENIFSQSALVREGIFRGEAMTAMMQEHLAGRVDHNFRLWMLLNLEVWHRLFIEGWERERLRLWIRANMRSAGPVEAP